MPESYTEYSVNWPQIFYARYVDEVVPLLYTNSSSYFAKMLAENEKFMLPKLQNNVLLGIMVNGDGSFVLTKWNETKAMIVLTNSKNYGATIWYGKAIVQDYRAEFKELWGNLDVSA